MKSWLSCRFLSLSVCFKGCTTSKMARLTRSQYNKKIHFIKILKSSSLFPQNENRENIDKWNIFEKNQMIWMDCQMMNMKTYEMNFKSWDAANNFNTVTTNGSNDIESLNWCSNWRSRFRIYLLKSKMHFKYTQHYKGKY